MPGEAPPQIGRQGRARLPTPVCRKGRDSRQRHPAGGGAGITPAFLQGQDTPTPARIGAARPRRSSLCLASLS